MKCMKASETDREELVSLYRRVTERMNKEGLDQWTWGEYPNEKLIAESIADGTQLVLRADGGEIAAAAVVYAGYAEDDASRMADVNWLFGGRPGWLHRLAVAPEYRGRGAGKALTAAAEDLLRAMGCACMRLDTDTKNTAARALYAGAGMRCAGTFDDHANPQVFAAYEKPLTDACPMLPLRMRPAFRCGSLTPWGGDRLPGQYGKPFPELPAGESLEVSCIPGLESTDEAGEKLPDLIRRYGERFAGRYADRPFPLLLKLIDAKTPLSVQVHPDDAYARAHENGRLGKTEAWLILEADENAELVYGVRPGTDRETLKRACENGRAVEPLLRRVRVRPGDVCYIPAGCVHAIGAGILLYEIQQSSDITYRFYDWDRVDAQGNRRPLHIRQALDVTDLSFALSPAGAPEEKSARVLDTDFFTLDLLRADGGETPLPGVRDFAFVTALDDGTELAWDGGSLPLRKGGSVYVPAACVKLALRGRGRAAVSMPEEKSAVRK